MPIYEYQARDPREACKKCRNPFETLQGINEVSLKRCPECGRGVKRVISWCRSAIMESTEEQAMVEHKLKDYEGSGMWSHAAELADKHSEKTKDHALKIRALDNYKKAGYDVDSFSADTKSNI